MFDTEGGGDTGKKVDISRKVERMEIVEDGFAMAEYVPEGVVTEKAMQSLTMLPKGCFIEEIVNEIIDEQLMSKDERRNLERIILW